MAYLSTTGTFTIDNITERRAVSSDPDAQEFVDLLGTTIYDLQAGSYDGANYDVSEVIASDSDQDRGYDLNDTDGDEMLTVLCTAIARNPSTGFQTHWASVANAAYDYAMDCQDTDLVEASKVLAALLALYDVGAPNESSMGAASVTGGRAFAASVTGGRG